jgi:Transcription factor WhiB
MPRGKGTYSREARDVCAGCSVQGPCLEEGTYGWATQKARLQGIWGGTSEKQRKELRAERAKEA